MDRRQALATLTAGLAASCSSNPAAVKVASKNFTEQVILGEILAQQTEARLGAAVGRSLNLGGTLLAHQALTAGQVDLYPEYSGTALAAILKLPVSKDADEVRQRVREGYAALAIDWLDPLGVDNTFAMIIPARQPFRTISEAAQGGPWSLGVGYEFEQRSDGLAALDATYPMKWDGRPKTMDLGLLYKALEDGQVSMIAANSTDGLLVRPDFRLLEDDKRAFPPYEVSVAVRRDALERTMGLREALDALSGKFTNESMQRLNYEVDVDHRSVTEVAREFVTRL